MNSDFSHQNDRIAEASIRKTAQRRSFLLPENNTEVIQNGVPMKKDRKRSLMIHSYKAIGIGLMAWMAGTVAIGLWRMMGSGNPKDKKRVVEDCKK